MCLREYYDICTISLTNNLARSIFNKFVEIAKTIETPYGEVIPYDPFPKQDYWKIDDYPVVAVEGFKVIQKELDAIMKFKNKK